MDIRNYIYCPALRSKKGEHIGLLKLRKDVARRVLPRLIVPPQQERNPDQDTLFFNAGVPALAIGIDHFWPDKSAMIDISYVIDEFGSEAMEEWLGNALDIAARKGVELVPCSELRALTGSLSSRFLKCAAARTGHYAISVSLSDVTNEVEIQNLISTMSKLGMRAENVIMIADFKDADLSDPGVASPIIADALDDLAGMARWGRIVFQASNFPDHNPAPKDGGIAKEIRSEWLIWQNVMRLSPGLKSSLIFGDYAADCSKIVFNKARSGAIPHLRYACDDSWLIARGVKGKDRGAEMRRVANLIVGDSAAYSGSEFSSSDFQIAQMASGSNVAKEPWVWRSINTGRHITLVVSQLGEDNGFSIEKGAKAQKIEQDEFWPNH